VIVAGHGDLVRSDRLPEHFMRRKFASASPLPALASGSARAPARSVFATDGRQDAIVDLVNEDGKLPGDCAVDGGCADCVMHLRLRRVRFSDTDLVQVGARGASTCCGTS
jgi:hypothetical protein